MKRHTPGPWKEVVVFGTIPYVVAPQAQEVVAERVFNGNETAIAALPDLLTAAEGALANYSAYLTSGEGDRALIPSMERLREAVAKAKGESA